MKVKTRVAALLVGLFSVSSAVAMNKQELIAAGHIGAPSETDDCTTVIANDVEITICVIDGEVVTFVTPAE